MIVNISVNKYKHEIMFYSITLYFVYLIINIYLENIENMLLDKVLISVDKTSFYKKIKVTIYCLEKMNS